MLILAFAQLFKVMQNPFRRCRGVDGKQLMENSFKQAALAAKRTKVDGTISEKAAQKEGVRIKAVGSAISHELKNVANTWPAMHRIPIIYKELADVLVGTYKIRVAVGNCIWTANRINDMKMKSLKRLENVRNTFEARDDRKYFYGRTAAFMRRCGKDMKLLLVASKLLHGLPDIKQLPTVIIAGLPNVGKTSLLKALTGSSPEISPWPFTTKGLMMGYAEFGFHKLQFVDTPGLLDRPESKRNPVEKQAVTVLRLLANLIVYVFDTSETCGYSLEQQVRQYNDVKSTFNKPIIAVANKVDIVGGRPVEETGVKVIPVSCDTKEGVEELKKAIKENIKA